MSTVKVGDTITIIRPHPSTYQQDSIRGVVTGMIPAGSNEELYGWVELDDRQWIHLRYIEQIYVTEKGSGHDV